MARAKTAKPEPFKLILQGKVLRKGKKVDMEKLRADLLTLKEMEGDYIIGLKRAVEFYLRHKK